MKKIPLFAVLLSSVINADSINSPLEKPSMAVSGIQREATPIVVTVYPFANVGQSCNSNMDTVAITPDRSMMLLCYNNVWTVSAVVQKQ